MSVRKEWTSSPISSMAICCARKPDPDRPDIAAWLREMSSAPSTVTCEMRDGMLSVLMCQDGPPRYVPEINAQRNLLTMMDLPISSIGTVAATKDPPLPGLAVRRDAGPFSP